MGPEDISMTMIQQRITMVNNDAQAFETEENPNELETK